MVHSHRGQGLRNFGEIGDMAHAGDMGWAPLIELISYNSPEMLAQK